MNLGLELGSGYRGCRGIWDLDKDLCLLKSCSKDLSSVSAGSHGHMPAVLPPLATSHRPCLEAC